MEPILRSLEESAIRLNSTADHANSLIRSINERMQKMGTGVEFWWNGKSFKWESLEAARITASDADEDQSETILPRWTQYSLGFVKIYGVWQLGARREQWGQAIDGRGIQVDQMFETEEEPLLSASRELRILMASELTKFIEAYTRRLTALADELRPPQQECADDEGARSKADTAPSHERPDPRIADHFDRRRRGVTSSSIAGGPGSQPPIVENASPESMEGDS